MESAGWARGDGCGELDVAGDRNLYVVDGSSFVTSARNHPTCTISALAFRAADNIIKNAKNGSIKSPTGASLLQLSFRRAIRFRLVLRIIIERLTNVDLEPVESARRLARGRRRRSASRAIWPSGGAASSLERSVPTTRNTRGLTRSRWPSRSGSASRRRQSLR